MSGNNFVKVPNQLGMDAGNFNVNPRSSFAVTEIQPVIRDSILSIGQEHNAPFNTNMMMTYQDKGRVLLQSVKNENVSGMANFTHSGNKTGEQMEIKDEKMNSQRKKNTFPDEEIPDTGNKDVFHLINNDDEDSDEDFPDFKCKTSRQNPCSQKKDDLDNSKIYNENDNFHLTSKIKKFESKTKASMNRSFVDFEKARHKDQNASFFKVNAFKNQSDSEDSNSHDDSDDDPFYKKNRSTFIRPEEILSKEEITNRISIFEMGQRKKGKSIRKTRVSHKFKTKGNLTMDIDNDLTEENKMNQKTLKLRNSILNAPPSKDKVENILSNEVNLVYECKKEKSTKNKRSSANRNKVSSIDNKIHKDSESNINHRFWNNLDAAFDSPREKDIMNFDGFEEDNDFLFNLPSQRANRMVSIKSNQVNANSMTVESNTATVNIDKNKADNLEDDDDFIYQGRSRQIFSFYNKNGVGAKNGANERHAISEINQLEFQKESNFNIDIISESANENMNDNSQNPINFPSETASSIIKPSNKNLVVVNNIAESVVDRYINNADIKVVTVNNFVLNYNPAKEGLYREVGQKNVEKSKIKSPTNIPLLNLKASSVDDNYPLQHQNFNIEVNSENNFNKYKRQSKSSSPNKSPANKDLSYTSNNNSKNNLMQASIECKLNLKEFIVEEKKRGNKINLESFLRNETNNDFINNKNGFPYTLTDSNKKVPTFPMERFRGLVPNNGLINKKSHSSHNTIDYVPNNDNNLNTVGKNSHNDSNGYYNKENKSRNRNASEEAYASSMSFKNKNTGSASRANNNSLNGMNNLSNNQNERTDFNPPKVNFNVTSENNYSKSNSNFAKQQTSNESPSMYTIKKTNNSNIPPLNAVASKTSYKGISKKPKIPAYTNLNSILSKTEADDDESYITKYKKQLQINNQRDNSKSRIKTNSDHKGIRPESKGFQGSNKSIRDPFKALQNEINISDINDESLSKEKNNKSRVHFEFDTSSQFVVLQKTLPYSKKNLDLKRKDQVHDHKEVLYNNVADYHTLNQLINSVKKAYNFQLSQLKNLGHNSNNINNTKVNRSIYHSPNGHQSRSPSFDTKAKRDYKEKGKEKPAGKKVIGANNKRDNNSKEGYRANSSNNKNKIVNLDTTPKGIKRLPNNRSPDDRILTNNKNPQTQNCKSQEDNLANEYREYDSDDITHPIKEDALLELLEEIKNRSNNVQKHFQEKEKDLNKEIKNLKQDLDSTREKEKLLKEENEALRTKLIFYEDVNRKKAERTYSDTLKTNLLNTTTKSNDENSGNLNGPGSVGGNTPNNVVKSSKNVNHFNTPNRSKLNYNFTSLGDLGEFDTEEKFSNLYKVPKLKSFIMMLKDIGLESCTFYDDISISQMEDDICEECFAVNNSLDPGHTCKEGKWNYKLVYLKYPKFKLFIEILGKKLLYDNLSRLKLEEKTLKIFSNDLKTIDQLDQKVKQLEHKSSIIRTKTNVTHSSINKSNDYIAKEDLDF